MGWQTPVSLCRTLVYFNQFSLSLVCSFCLQDRIVALVLIYTLLYHARRGRHMQKRSGALCYWRHINPLPPQQQLASLLGFYACCIPFDQLRISYLYLSLYFFIAAYCSPPNNPVNGTVHSLTGTKLGSTLRFSCDQGFRLIGQSSATCTRTAQGIYQWNAPVPLCQGEGSTITAGDEVDLEIVPKRMRF